MTEYYNHKKQRDFICVDEDADYVPGTKANKDGALLYPVEGVCGSLPCKPYVAGREFTCAVCTKWQKTLVTVKTEGYIKVLSTDFIDLCDLMHNNVFWFNLMYNRFYVGKFNMMKFVISVRSIELKMFMDVASK